MRLLDLFCGAGGCSMGYHRAGFDVVGVDINPQPHYPFQFIQADAMTFPLDGFDVIHASPPCQQYSTLKGLGGDGVPRLVSTLRKRLSGRQYVIENVVGADLMCPLMLCGSMFGLQVWRHRLFELSELILCPLQCRHRTVNEPVDVTGTGSFQHSPRKQKTGGLSRKPKSLSHAQEAMGIDWMPRKYLSQAIPPAYTEWIGRQIMEASNVVA